MKEGGKEGELTKKEGTKEKKSSDGRIEEKKVIFGNRKGSVGAKCGRKIISSVVFVSKLFS